MDYRGFPLERAAGGKLAHMVPPGSNVALCGHEPIQKANSVIANRARWYPTSHPPRPLCGKCKDNADSKASGGTEHGG